MTNQTIEARLDELETRLAFQDDMISALNEQVAQQELDIRKLWEAKQHLKKQLSEVSPSNIRSDADEAPPPHY
ncbi:SlyX family protein [Marinobacter caseinilyticus]|uniref:SlyX family protein n=1 Tax=Marinobacter caseinilyticus TaxID=2692195 RepID=UPI0014087260|nr:SlyX family protein [Marinobacter caseinilyticus]